MIYFFNQLYFTHQLPWYYSFFMIGVTTPEPFIALALLGTLSITLRKEHWSVALPIFFPCNFHPGFGPYARCRPSRWRPADAVSAAFHCSFSRSGFSYFAQLGDEFFPKAAYPDANYQTEDKSFRYLSSPGLLQPGAWMSTCVTRFNLVFITGLLAVSVVPMSVGWRRLTLWKPSRPISCARSTTSYQ